MLKEELISQCIRKLCMPEDLDRALEEVLAQVGQFLSAERVYLYQRCEGKWRQVQQWHAPGSQVPSADTWPCEQSWAGHGTEPHLLYSLEALGEVCPSLYSMLNHRGVTAAAVVLLGTHGQVTGCLGVDNPCPQALVEAGPLLQALGCAITVAQFQAANQRELDYLRRYDMLTGALCRESYLQRLEALPMEKQSVGIVRLSINGIRSINENYGYTSGDQLLVKCATGTAQLFQSTGSLYRVGSDEFAVICLGLTREAFEAQAALLGAVLAEKQSCPVAVGYQWTARPRTIRQLDMAADAMMQEEKQRYVRLQVLSQRQHVLEDTYGMLSIDGVTTLLAEERFAVYLQPKLSFRDGKLVGAEALVRFWDVDGTIVEPGRFLPDLEAAMLIKYVDFYVFEKACYLIHAWQERNAATSISVNFSKLTLEEPGLVSRLLHCCRKYDVAPGCLEVEISGSADKLQAGHLSKIVDQIREAGFTTSVDDFGIRFVNLSLLIALDCDKLKVDRSLVESITTSLKAQSVLKALAALCAATGTRTTVEGIETEDQFALLKNMGFDEMQGYLISQPLSTAEFEEQYLHT